MIIHLEPDVKLTKMDLVLKLSNPHPFLESHIYDMPHLFIKGPALRIKGLRRLVGLAHPLGTKSNPEHKAAMAYVLKDTPIIPKFTPNSQGVLSLNLFYLFPWLITNLPAKKIGRYKMELRFKLTNAMTIPSSPVPYIKLDEIDLQCAVRYICRPSPSLGSSSVISSGSTSSLTSASVSSFSFSAGYVFSRPAYFFDEVEFAPNAEISYTLETDCTKFLIQAYDEDWRHLDFSISHTEAVEEQILDGIAARVYVALANSQFKAGQKFVIQAVHPEFNKIRYVKVTLFLQEQVRLL